MAKLMEMLGNARSLRQREREIRELQGQLDKLRTENERMRQAMRRCLGCEYRLEAIASPRR